MSISALTEQSLTSARPKRCELFELARSPTSKPAPAGRDIAPVED